MHYYYYSVRYELPNNDYNFTRLIIDYKNYIISTI